MSKRMSEDNTMVDDIENIAKRQRLRQRSSSEPPLRKQTAEPLKREALKRLFGRSTNKKNKKYPKPPKGKRYHFIDIHDENDDPLLSTVPVNMIPEQLGFLLCAQETLGFLHDSGFSTENPVFVLLRSHLLQGMADIAAA